MGYIVEQTKEEAEELAKELLESGKIKSYGKTEKKDSGFTGRISHKPLYKYWIKCE